MRTKTVFDGSDNAADFVDRPTLVINQAGDNTQTAFGPVSLVEALSLLESREPFAWSYRDADDKVAARGRDSNYSELRALAKP